MKLPCIWSSHSLATPPCGYMKIAPVKVQLRCFLLQLTIAALLATDRVQVAVRHEHVGGSALRCARGSYPTSADRILITWPAGQLSVVNVWPRTLIFLLHLKNVSAATPATKYTVWECSHSLQRSWNWDSRQSLTSSYCRTDTVSFAMTHDPRYPRHDSELFVYG